MTTLDHADRNARSVNGRGTARWRGSYQGRGLHGEVVEELGRRILAGDVAEGQTLDIVVLETELEVSRTVLREALRVLKDKGLVDARQKRGTFVQPRAEWKLLDADVMRWQFAGHDADRLFNELTELRGIIEPAAASLAALRRTDEDLAALDATLDQMARAAASGQGSVKADLAFHRALLEATHNELLVQTESVFEPGLAARDHVVHAVFEDDDPTPAHAAVRDAIRDHDPDRAKAAASALLNKSLLDLDRVRGRSHTPPQNGDGKADTSA